MTSEVITQRKVIVDSLRAIDRRLNRSDIRAICLIILITYSIMLGATFVTHVSGRTMFGPQLGADFAAFYVAGSIFNTSTPDRIYDRQLQRQRFHELFPTAPANEELPYVNAPFFILPFSLLAQLPYAWAYLLWLLISLGLYLFGFRLLWKTLGAMPEDAYSIALLLGLSFMPFLVECLAGGQTSAVGFFALAWAIGCERRGRILLSGAALSLCSYKPTLLFLVLPMLVITRRLSTLIGFAAGCALLSLISFLTVGWSGLAEYLGMLMLFTQATTGAGVILKDWKYVDLNSFFRLLLKDHNLFRWSLTGAAFLLALPPLVRVWWKSSIKRDAEESLVWALTITWALVLNLYLGIYDATLVVLSILLTTNANYRRANNRPSGLSPAYRLLLLLLFLTPWVTQPLARVTHIQVFTIVLAALGYYQLRLFGQQGDKFEQV